jgi:multiple sugar transport system permease protein
MDIGNLPTVSQESGTNKKVSRSVVRRIEENFGYILLLPAIIVMGGIAFFPIIRTFWLSLHHLNIKFVDHQKFVGFDNYTKLMKDDRFWGSLKNTFIFTVSSVSLEFILGLGFALVMHKVLFGRSLIRTAILIPWAIPPVISGLMWRYMYNDQFGVVNAFLYKLGLIDEYIDWFDSGLKAMVASIFADVWQTTPFMALLLLAGLQTIPHDIYEAADIDGASSFQKFIRITLPLLKPSILVALLFRTLDAFRVFDLIYILTGGGPADSTEVLSMYAYKTMSAYLDFGYGSTISIIIFITIILISLFYVKVLGTNIRGEG